jgi:hypothetical protein
MISEKKKIEEHEVINHQQRYFFINQQRKFFFFFSQICTAISTCEASHHHRPQETHPTATPRRRDPPHGQACRQALPCLIPTVWRSPIRADLGLDEWVSSQ